MVDIWPLFETPFPKKNALSLKRKLLTEDDRSNRRMVFSRKATGPRARKRKTTRAPAKTDVVYSIVAGASFGGMEERKNRKWIKGLWDRRKAAKGDDGIQKKETENADLGTAEKKFE